MVTGGIRRKQAAEKVIESGVDMVGIATALAIEPNLPNAWKQGQNLTPELKPITWKNKTLASLANMAVVKFHLRNLSAGKNKTKCFTSLGFNFATINYVMPYSPIQKGMRDYSFAS